MWEIGKRLRERRENAGLTQGQVAAYEGYDVNYISKLERGTNHPNVWPLLARLAERYRTTTDYLLGVTDDPSQQRAENRVQEDALLAQLPGHERAIVRALLLVLARETPAEREFTLEVIERLLLPAQPQIIGEVPDDPTDPQEPPAALVARVGH